MPGFFGTYRHQIDEKGRLRIPAKLKDRLGEHPFITRGPKRSLLVIPEGDAERLFEERFQMLDPLDPESSKALRIMASSGFFAEEDKQGRILLPSVLIAHAGIKKNIVTIGSYTWVEIWSEENWEPYGNADPETFDACLKHIWKKGPNNE